jgi:aspartate-semialdehyde dehydrogenase
VDGPGFGNFKQGAICKIDKAASELLYGVAPRLRAKFIEFDLLKCPSTDPQHPWISEQMQHFRNVIDAHIKEGTAGCDVVLFASESDISKQYVPIAAHAGAYAIDNSSAFRMDSSVPLVVPEVNGELISPAQKVYANPNCVAAIMVMALWPLHQAGKLKRVIASTYQSASGAGRPAMDELEESTRAYLKGEVYQPRVLPHPYAFNLFSHNTAIGADG